MVKTPDNQSFFDKTIKHFVKQGTQAKMIGRKPGVSACAYRGKNNTKCAIGCHIPNSVYNELMENKSVRQLLNTFPKLGKYMPPDLSLASWLQEIHDCDSYWRDPKDMVTKLQACADMFQLDTTVLYKLDFSKIKPGAP